MQPEEEDSWQGKAPASAKGGTVPVTCGQAKGCQVWDKYFLKILSLLVKRYLILLWVVLLFFFLIYSFGFLEHPSDKIMFQKKKNRGEKKCLVLSRNQRRKGVLPPSQLLKKLAV